MRHHVPAGYIAVLAGLAASCGSSGARIAPDSGAPGHHDAGTHPDSGADASVDAGSSTDAADELASQDAPASTESGGEDGGGDAGADATLPTLVSLTVSTGSLVPAFDPSVTDYTMTSLNALYPIQVTATTSDGSALTIHGAPASSGVPVSFQLAALEDFTVSVGARSYVVHYTPSDIPSYSVSTTGDAGAENMLLSPDGKYIVVMDRAGAPLYYRTFQPSLAQNFQQFALPGGSIAYAAEVGGFNGGGWLAGVAHVMDQRFGDVADYALLAHAQHGALGVDGHDFLLLGPGHYVALAYVQRTLDLSGLNSGWSTQAPVVSAVVQEVSAGAVSFEWDSANVPSLYSDSLYKNTFQAGVVSDYLHMNSMCVDPSDGNFIFSFRHTSSIVKVDRTTGNILWTLGGKEDQFGLSSTQVFAFQHYVRMEADGSLWVFDNGNGAHQTRIVSFVLDQANKKVTSFTDVYDKPSTQPPSTLMGSYGQLGAARYLFGWGGWTTGNVEPSVTEVSGGSVVWSLTFADPSVFSYRALPITAP